jgi:hypothetical protein
MKKVVILILALVVALPLLAQEQTLLGDKEFESSIYGGPVVKFTTINGDFGVMVGARGGWIINHALTLGIAGYGLANRVDANSLGPMGEKHVDLGYGGLDLEWVFSSDDMIHFSVGTLIGAGGVGFRNRFVDRDWNYLDHPWDNFVDPGPFSYNGTHHNFHAFFVAEPSAYVDLNLTSWFRLSAGASFRYVSGLNSTASTNKDLTGVSGNILLRFGAF